MAANFSSIKIYGLPIQPLTCEIHALCKSIGIREEFVPCNIQAGEQNKPEYVAKFPMHCVPALEDTENGLCITECNAILRYIARKYDSAFYPKDLKQAAICDMVMDHRLFSLGKDIASNVIYPKAGFAPAVEPDAARAAFDKMKKDQWPAIQKFIEESGGPFVCGQQLTIADLSVWGFVKVASLVSPDCPIFQECKGLQAWFDMVEGSMGDDWFSDDNWGFWKSKAAAQ